MSDVNKVNAKPVEGVPTVSVFGIPFCKFGMQDTVSYLTEIVSSGRPHQIITANPIMVMAAKEDPAYKKMMQQADLIVPDGTGVVWAAKIGGDPLTERVPGFDLLHELMKQGERRRWKVYLLGSAPEVIQEAARRLTLQYPDTEIVGFRDGYFGPDQDQEVIDAIVQASPDLLFVARGADTQEPWIAKHKAALSVPIIMGVGGSFDVISGKTKRAPMFFRKLRIEWLYRLLKEPTRFRRMLALPKFVLWVLRERENITKMG
ncbi:WecB/TagA/CpsF family glycosyltransferase [Paenibacillus segetis]|uniref:N-acetylglucosaminyldiphosphoundecaprenol N-acetyl-beta-D-mannosaminyltransferase n=1 Tax=Paenibacillus segetis TaxID=1325360 RepID=A0ABQ1YNL8_9BACL|nr:WecB/TagA/CpsF family glycosyltransferase [Paenibacillus segetis]GGH32858.1 acetylglucosaminyldiphosphoundecaprenol acetyl-beta-D-mannosaminyltransferase [Paenibacillus segetis]